MKVSKQFLRDFAYVANLYGWNAEDVEDAKAQTRANPGELVPYWTRLAAAHRAGYQQTADNNYMRLGRWLQLQGNEHSNLGAPPPARKGGATSKAIYQQVLVDLTGLDAPPEEKCKYECSPICSGMRRRQLYI